MGYTCGFQLVYPNIQSCAVASTSSYQPVVRTHKATPWFPPVVINLCTQRNSILWPFSKCAREFEYKNGHINFRNRVKSYEICQY
jgi:hypothetical protein